MTDGADLHPGPLAESPARRTIWPRIAQQYLFPLLGALMLARLVLAAALVCVALPGLWDNSYPEGALAARAWDAARGLPVYQDWREWPHAFAPYSPLTYYLPAWVARAAGMTARPWDLYLIGRLQSLAALCALGWTVGALARRAGASAAWATLAVCAFFGWQQLVGFLASYRPDAPEAALALASVWIAAGGAATGPRALTALGCLSAAWWFKATPWGASLLFGWWLIGSAPRRSVALGSALAAVALNLGLALGLDARTHGLLFLNMIGSLDNGWVPANFLDCLAGANLFPELLMFFGAGAAAAALPLLQKGRSAISFSRVWLARGALLALACSLAQLLKAGADINYLSEPFALGCAMAAPTLERAWSLGPRLPSPSRRVLPAVATLLLWAALAGGALWDGGRSLLGARYALREELDRLHDLDVTDRARGIDGPLLTIHPFLALQRPASPTVLDLVQWSILVRRGRLDPTPLLERVKAEEFAAVIVTPRYIAMDRTTRFIEPLKAAIHQHYEKVEEDELLLWLMLPRGRPEPLPTSAGPAATP